MEVFDRPLLEGHLLLETVVLVIQTAQNTLILVRLGGQFLYDSLGFGDDITLQVHLLLEAFEGVLELHVLELFLVKFLK